MKRNLLKKYFVVLPILAFSPSFIFAQNFVLGGNSTFKTFIEEIIGVLQIIQPLMYAGAFMVFFWGLSKFILNSNNEKEIQAGKKYMLWGVIVLFVLLSVKTIITLVSNDFGLDGNASVLPHLPDPTTSGKMKTP